MESDHGKVDVLANSAGIARAIPHRDVDALADEILAFNAREAICDDQIVPAAAAQERHVVVVNVCSVAASSGKGTSMA